MNKQTMAFGAIRRPQDSRDWNLGSLTPSTPIPTNYFTDISALPVEYQRQIPNCGAESGQEIQSIMLGVRGSPALLWKHIKQLDGFPPEAGTSMNYIFKALKSKGMGLYGCVSEDTTVSIATYTDPWEISKDDELDAKTRMIGSYAFLSNISMDSLKEAIYKNKVVILLLEIGDTFWKPSWKEVSPIKPPASIVSGHFVTAYGYDENYIYFRNHWSTEWSKQGNGHFGSDYVPFIVEAGTVVEPSGKYQFNKNLSLGMTDSDVYFLQKRLNENPKTQVAISGSGSLGNETYYFGGLTQRAVIKYQQLNGILNTGFVGPLTRASLNM